MAKSVDAYPFADRIGLGWRPEIGVDILGDLHEIDIVEVVAENCASLSKADLKAFHRLSSHIPIVVHAVSLGLASTYPVSAKHLEIVARVVNAIQPEAWSEHLAFVRTPNGELGHLAAPPWCEETVEGAVKNIQAAGAVVGALPHLENIATLYSPLGSTFSETAWITAIVKNSGSKLLIDLQNIYANSRNFKTDWISDMLRLPLDEVTYVHIAGGREVSDEAGEYFLDDHMHPVSQDVFTLLEELAAQTSQPLTVILERDGNYPRFEQLRAELSQARQALLRGRGRGTRRQHAC